MKNFYIILLLFFAIILFTAQTGLHRKVYTSGGGCGNPPHPTYVNSGQSASFTFPGGSNYNINKTISWNGTAGDTLFVSEITSSYGSITITSITDDGGNTWSSVNSLWGYSPESAPDTWTAVSINATTTLTLTYHVTGIPITVDAIGAAMVAEYSNFPRSSVTTVFAGNPQQQLSYSNTTRTLVGFFLYSNITASNSFTGPYIGGISRQVINVTRILPDPNTASNYGNLALVDSLSGSGTISDNLSNPQASTNEVYMVGVVVGPTCP